MESAASRVTPLREPEPPGQQPPQNAIAESALLGAIFINNAAYQRVSGFLLPEHFSVSVHGRIFEAIGKLLDRDIVASPITLKTHFDQDGALAEIGGAAYLARLVASAVTIINVPSYGRIIYDLFVRRRLIEVGQEIVASAYLESLDETATQQLERAEASLSALAESKPIERDFVRIGETVDEELRRTEEAYKLRMAGSRPYTFSTGLIDLDSKLSGLIPSFVYVIAGRPGAGKTSFVQQIAFHVARSLGQAVAFFQLDETRGQSARRMLAAESTVSALRQQSGDVDFAHFERLAEAAGKLREIPFYVDDSPGLSVAQMRFRTRRLARRVGLGLVVIDHAQIIGGKGDRYEMITAATADVKRLAKELNVPVLLVSQLSRSVESRDDKRPQLADLRESGSLEQDADVVLFPFREEYYLQRAEPKQADKEPQDKFNDRHDRWRRRCEETFGLCEMIIAKHRGGPIGTVRLYFDAETGVFDNYAGSDRTPEPLY